MNDYGLSFKEAIHAIRALRDGGLPITLDDVINGAEKLFIAQDQTSIDWEVSSACRRRLKTA